MQSPQGAILQFDAFDLKQGKVGKLIAGKLIGAVTIRSDQREPGPQDDLQIITSDVDMTEQRFTYAATGGFQSRPKLRSRSFVADRYGPAGLQTRVPRHDHAAIVRRRRDARHARGGNKIFPGGRKNATTSAASTTAEAKKPGLPIEISCRGPFRFDFMKNVATFKDKVDVKRETVRAQRSTELSVVVDVLRSYGAAGGPAAETANGEPDKTGSNLQPVRLEADGSPVIVHAHSNGMQARGQHIDYLIKTGAVTIRGEPEAIVEQGGREIHARELTYQPDPSGHIGQFTANGQGWVRGSAR